MIRYGFRRSYLKESPFPLSWRKYYGVGPRAAITREDLDEARRWLAGFVGVSPKYYQLSYSRSSGPGGQNVNKYVRTHVQQLKASPAFPTDFLTIKVTLESIFEG